MSPLKARWNAWLVFIAKINHVSKSLSCQQDPTSHRSITFFTCINPSGEERSDTFYSQKRPHSSSSFNRLFQYSILSYLTHSLVQSSGRAGVVLSHEYVKVQDEKMGEEDLLHFLFSHLSMEYDWPLSLFYRGSSTRHKKEGNLIFRPGDSGPFSHLFSLWMHLTTMWRREKIPECVHSLFPYAKEKFIGLLLVVLIR